jgi:hypothetical protein
VSARGLLTANNQLGKLEPPPIQEPLKNHSKIDENPETNKQSQKRTTTGFSTSKTVNGISGGWELVPDAVVEWKKMKREVDALFASKDTKVIRLLDTTLHIPYDKTPLTGGSHGSIQRAYSHILDQFYVLRTFAPDLVILPGQRVIYQLYMIASAI